MTINLYRKRRLRFTTQPILTRAQIKDLGRIINISSFRESTEFFMDPFNYFKLSKLKMAELHTYLIKHGITKEKCPRNKIRQGDHTRILISILFPGYPIAKASEHYYQHMRENRSPQIKTLDLAYDQLPTTARYERLEEVFRTKVEWTGQETHDSSSSYVVDIPLKRLNRSIVTEGGVSSNYNVRLFLYLWSSERISWNANGISLYIGKDEKDCINESDKELHSYGFNHIDITEKSSMIYKANRRTTDDISLTFISTDPNRPVIRHISVCAVAEKSPEELVSQLYVQTCSFYIGQAMERFGENNPTSQKVQLQATELLNKYNRNDKLNLCRAEELFISCAEIFLPQLDDGNENENETKVGDLEISVGEEFVSVLDPIMLSTVVHPARCVFCTHTTCFDAIIFFKFHTASMRWKCPICSVKIRDIQDLYIDYQMKIAVKAHPGQDRFLRENNGTYSYIPSATFKEKITKQPFEVIAIKDEENYNTIS